MPDLLGTLRISRNEKQVFGFDAYAGVFGARVRFDRFETDVNCPPRRVIADC